MTGAIDHRRGGERGVTLVELMITLLVLAIGLLAVSQLFPAGTRNQQRDRLMTLAVHYAQEKVEQLQGRTWLDPDLSVGRHPAGTAVESLEGGAIERWYDVAAMAAPLDNLKKVTVTVRYHSPGQGSRTATTVTYMRR
jgi:prepilin-type N-terminal cleavage/methylation domain-containing protein